MDDDPTPASSNPASEGAETAAVPVDAIPSEPLPSHLLANRQETARLYMAVFFAVLFVLTVVLSYISLLAGHWTQTKEWLQIILPAETALLGSAVGFYFGAKR